jgi:seryl-tRNA synthetase
MARLSGAHYQQKDGSVLVPEALRPYLGTDVIR